MAVYDQTWKEAIEKRFEPFVAFFFPNVHHDIDWSRGWKWLDNELRQVPRDAERNGRTIKSPFVPPSSAANG